MRQDAVMQQVFGLMNSLLSRAGPKLQIRTFKVVPLSQRSGILEWCVNTEPISEFLIGLDKCSGAHQRYHVKDLTATQCQVAMKKISLKCQEEVAIRSKIEQQIRSSKKSINPAAQTGMSEAEAKKKRVQSFKEICQRFRPVFRHFFYENFTSTYQLLERKLAFTRLPDATLLPSYPE